MRFADTSVLVAASMAKHPRQASCLNRLAQMEAKEGACAAHTLTEIFAVLTRLPIHHRVPPHTALEIVKHTSKRFTIVHLTMDEQLATIQRFVAEGLSGAMIYDAMILACARKINATKIYTLDPKHFTRIAPDLASRILEP